MKYLLTIMIVSLLSCNKKNYDIPRKTIIKPSITGIEVSSQMIVTQTGTKYDTVNRPKITFTLNIPDTSSVHGLYVYKIDNYASASYLTNLKSGKISVVDMNQVYPPISTMKYTSIFGLADGNALMNDTFDVK